MMNIIDFFKEFEFIKRRRLRSLGGAKICSGVCKSSGGCGRIAAPPLKPPLLPLQCNGITAVLLPLNSAMIESLNANKSFKNIYKDKRKLQNSVYVVFYMNMLRP